MKLTPAPFDSKLDVYQRQAEVLLAAWRNGDPEALETIRHNHPHHRFARMTLTR